MALIFRLQVHTKFPLHHGQSENLFAVHCNDVMVLSNKHILNQKVYLAKKH